MEMPNGIWMKTTYWYGQHKVEECLEHEYHWLDKEPGYVYRGQLPKMGSYKCIYCDRPLTGMPALVGSGA